MSDNCSSVHPGAIDSMTKLIIRKVSEDGYIRLSLRELQRVKLAHLISGLDETEIDNASHGATQAVITGYTEWLSDDSPKITIGWDWKMEFSDGHIKLRRIGAPRSNLMIQDSNGNDTGYEKSILLQELYIDEMDWQSVVMAEINLRYR